ncbi:MAG: hypothetical protein ACK50A_02255 [Sphingobacteriaceae bacterium]|jgi:hypothetical protein
MRIVNEEGDITMYDGNGMPVTIIKVENGITYGAKGSKANQVTRVTVYPQVYGLSDVWLFYDDKIVPFHHIQSRDLAPHLKKCYIEFITQSETYCFQEFLTIIISDYFIGKLKYQLPEGYSLFMDSNSQ